jgi:uncharacterized protein YhbP (UPF0306 family)
MIPDSILDFIASQTCATVCCVGRNDNDPYCFSCFYALDPEQGSIYFKSSAKTFHSTLMSENHFISGTIHPDKLNPMTIRGIQFRGVVIDPEHPLGRKASEAYHAKFPLAKAMPGEVWTIRLSHIKMTDNSKTFGEKIVWTRAEEKVHAA